MKDMERDESRKQGATDMERNSGGIRRGKEVENDSPSLQIIPCWHLNVLPLFAY